MEFIGTTMPCLLFESPEFKPTGSIKSFWAGGRQEKYSKKGKNKTNKYEEGRGRKCLAKLEETTCTGIELPASLKNR